MPGLEEAPNGSLDRLGSPVGDAAADDFREAGGRPVRPAAGLSDGEREALLGRPAPAEFVPGASAPSGAEAGSETPRDAAGFGPAGVIRRRLRSGDEAQAVAAPAPPDRAFDGCRRLAALPHAAAYRLPGLTSAVDGLIGALGEIRAGQCAVLALCGACERSGTSTLALAAALRLAGEGARVLLVDADLRSPRLSELLGAVSPGPDLRAVLRGESPLASALSYASAENLAVVPCRPARHSGHGGDRREPPPPSRAALNAFLDACRSRFAAVILDAGSAAEGAAALAVAGAAGRAVLVVRSGRVTARTAAGLKFRMNRAGVALEGAILTFGREEA